MNTDKLIELAFYTLPALVTGGVAYYLFQSHFADQEGSRKWLLRKENQKQALPLRLQAYERLALLLERINPSKLLIRVAPLNNNKQDYQNLLIHTIEQEFDHNITQQIYVSDECWTMIATAKSTIIQNIRAVATSPEVEDANQLRENILNQLLEVQSASSIALSYLKEEVKEFL
jgi:hypothetical protein